MSTDLYGVRVLNVAPGELRALFRIFVVYYDVHGRSHAPLPDDDVGFFFRVLWEAAHDRPITGWNALQAVALDDFLDEEWGEANSHLYVRRVDRVAARNHPVGEDGWEDLHDFYYQRDGGWANEDRLVQADYDVRVTDPRWLEPLAPGHCWGTTVYVTNADRVGDPAAPTVVDLRGAARVLDPFPGGGTETGTPSDLVFSDDGEYLAVTSQDCELVVYRTADWSEHARIPNDDAPWGQDIQWVPGTRLLTRRVLEGYVDPPTTAYDADTGEPADVPSQPGEARSRSGRYRADPGCEGHVDFAAAPEGTPRRAAVPGGDVRVHSISFTADEARMFVGKGDDVHVLDPATGRCLRTVPGARSEAVVRPDGAYFAAYGNDEPGAPESVDLRRADDGRLLMRCRPKGHRHVSRLAWSPDGRVLAAAVIEDHNGYGGEIHLFEPGAPLTAPEAEEPSEKVLRARIDGSYNPADIMVLTGMLADRADDAAGKARVWRAAATRLEDWATSPEAADAYRRAIEHGTPVAAAADGLSLSRLLHRMRDLDGAVDAARDALRAVSGLEDGDGDGDGALELEYSAAVRLADMTRTRGGRGDLDEAEDAYRFSLGLKPGRPWSLLGLGWVAAKRDDHEAARPYLLQAVDAGDAHAEGYAAMLLGSAAKKARNVAEALRWYKRALKADNRHAPLATGHLGELHYRVGDGDGARHWYERMLKVTEEPALVAEACCRLGEIAAEDGDTPRAVEHLKRAARTDDATFAAPARELLERLVGK